MKCMNCQKSPPEVELELWRGLIYCEECLKPIVQGYAVILPPLFAHEVIPDD